MIISMCVMYVCVVCTCVLACACVVGRVVKRGVMAENESKNDIKCVYMSCTNCDMIRKKKVNLLQIIKFEQFKEHKIT